MAQPFQVGKDARFERESFGEGRQSVFAAPEMKLECGPVELCSAVRLRQLVEEPQAFFGESEFHPQGGPA